jgi:hypothetical protein
MSLRVPAAIAVGISLIVLPIIIVRAQAEGETEAPPTTETVAEPAQETTTAEEAPQDTEATPSAEEGGSVLGAETSTETATTPDPASPGEESAAPAANGEAASTSAVETLALDTASSTASSTEPLPDAPVEHFTVPEEEPFVLQPAVSFSVSGNTATADIVLENLTCKACEKVLPELDVFAYYAPWYPNDGPIEAYDEAKSRSGEQQIKVSDLANWSSHAMTWSAENIAPGRYYFVVEIDPENKEDAHRIYRSEFSI